MSAAALAEAFVALRVDASNLDQDIERGTQASIDKALPDMEKHGERVGERIGKGMGDGIEEGLDGVDGPTKKVGRSLEDMGELADGAETRITGLKDTVEGLGALMEGPGEDGIGAYLQGWADFASGVANFIVPVISALVPQIIKTGLANIWASTQAVAAGAAAKVMAAGQWLLNAALSANPIGLVVAAIALLVAAFVVAWNNSETFRNIVIGAWEGIKRAALAVVGWFQSYVWPTRKVVIDLIVGYYKFLWSALQVAYGFVQEKGGQIVGWFKELPGKIGGFISGIAQVLTLPFRTAFNAIANLWNSTVGKLEFKAPDWVPGIGGKGWEVPDIPTFGDGGYVPATPGGRIVRVSERGQGEFIGTESMMRRRFGGGPSVTVQVDARGADVGAADRLRAVAQDIADATVAALVREVGLS